MSKKKSLTYRLGEQVFKEKINPLVVQDDPSALYRYWLFLEKGWDLTDYVHHLDQPMGQNEWLTLQQVIHRLNQYEPLQYIVGRAYFYDQIWQVDPRVLIPRPETEELVNQARLSIERLSADRPRILDIGTGSGIIALTLKQLFPTSDVWASDLSKEALLVAQQNATWKQLQVNFKQGSLLEPFTSEELESVDLIVSNPPYIAVHEQSIMDESVKRFEPLTALYAEQNGLAIYDTLFQQVKERNISPIILLEYGYTQGEAIEQLAHQRLSNWHTTRLQDFQGHDRIMILDPSE